MSDLDKLKKIEFEDNAALADYCRTLRNLSRDLAQELAYSTDELLERLASVPDATGPLHAGSRIRARLVVRQLVPARDAAAYVAHCAVATERAFTKHFAPELDRMGRSAKKPKFSFD
jgi:hypothetical protein